MNVKISKKNIWWDDVSDNKPSYSWFNSFKNTMESSNIKVNQKSYSIIEIVVPKTDISYIWINDGKYNYYYFYNRVLKIMDNAYLLEFKLDVFTTFTLPYFDYLKNSNKQIKINRHKKFSLEGLQWEDDMLNSVPYITDYIEQWNGNNVVATLNENPARAILTTQLPQEYGWRGTVQNTHRAIAGEYKPFIKPSIYIVCSDLTPYNYVDGDDLSMSNRINIIPVLDQNKSTINLDAMGSNAPKWWTDNNQKLKDDGLWNGYQWLIDRVVAKYPSKCKGIYLGPPLWMIDPKYTNLFFLNTRNDGKGDDHLTLYIQMNQEGVPLWGNNYSKKTQIDTGPKHITMSAPDHLNKSDKLSVYASNVINFKINNNETKLFNYLQQGDTTPKLYYGLGGGVWTNFTSQFFLINKLKNYGGINGVLPYAADLPFYFDEYNKYIQNTKNTRDTGMNIAAQQMGLGVAKGAFNVAFSAASSAAGAMTLNPEMMLGGAKGVVDAGFSITQSVLGYANKKAMMNAELADKRMSMNTEIRAGNIEDAAISTIITRLQSERNAYFEMGEFFEYAVPNTDTIKALNNVLYLYGQYNPKINTLNYFTESGRDFNYYKFDAEYLSNIFATTIREAGSVPVQREFYNHIFNYLTAGVRLWDKTPIW